MYIINDKVVVPFSKLRHDELPDNFPLAARSLTNGENCPSQITLYYILYFLVLYVQYYRIVIVQC